MTVADPLRVGVALAALAAIAVLALALARVHLRRDLLVAVGRATLQLVLVALVIAWIFRHPEGVAVYLLIMLGAAAVTSTRRIGLGLSRAPLLAVPIAAGALAALLPVLASGALELRAETVVPFVAQVLGGSMTAASLTGGRLRDDVAGEWGVVEGWLALGYPPRQAVTFHARRAVARALVPALDQTRNAGLVVLPGVFVGLLLAGASPAEAGALQLLVLVGLLAAETVSAALTATVLAGHFGARRPTMSGH